MKKSIFSLLLTTCLSIGTPVLAQTTKVMETYNVDDNATAIAVQVYEGYGLNISFLETEEVITYANLDNPARYSITFDEPLCEAKGNCQAGQPRLIHLRLIEGVTLPGLTEAPGKRTFLTVKTRDANNRSRLYVIHLSAAKGIPPYHTLSLQSAPKTFSGAKLPVSVPISNLVELTDIAQGLAFAQAEAKLPDNPNLWRQVGDFISLVKEGVPLAEAVEKTGVSLDLIRQLEAWGSEATP